MSTSSTTRFNIHKFYTLPTDFIYVIIKISEHVAITSLYRNNWWVFIKVTEGVYCAVRSGSFHVLQANFRVSKINSYHLRFLQRKITVHETDFLMNELQLWMLYWNSQRNFVWYKTHDDLRVCCENKGNLIWVQYSYRLFHIQPYTTHLLIHILDSHS